MDKLHIMEKQPQFTEQAKTETSDNQEKKNQMLEDLATKEVKWHTFLMTRFPQLNQQHREDIIQEAYQKLLAPNVHPDAIKDPENYFMSILRNVRLNQLRTGMGKASFQSIDDIEHSLDLVSDALNPEQQVIQQAGIDRVNRWIDHYLNQINDSKGLSTKIKKDLIFGFYINHESVTELANRYGVKPSTIRVVVYRFRQYLKRKLISGQKNK